MKGRDTDELTVYLPKGEKARVKHLAYRDGRTVSNWARQAFRTFADMQDAKTARRPLVRP